MTADQRLAAAREYLEYARKVHVADLPTSPLTRMAAELRRQLGQVLDVVTELEAEVAARVRPDGSADLTPADVLTVVGALHIAAWWADYAGGRETEVARYRALSRTLGDDR